MPAQAATVIDAISVLRLPLQVRQASAQMLNRRCDRPLVSVCWWPASAGDRFRLVARWAGMHGAGLAGRFWKLAKPFVWENWEKRIASCSGAILAARSRQANHSAPCPALRCPKPTHSVRNLARHGPRPLHVGASTRDELPAPSVCHAHHTSTTSTTPARPNEPLVRRSPSYDWLGPPSIHALSRG
ncbi:uncharacterized protein BDZ99DRAFT_523948 [Mytilinidion resinicola]|uniref:Uncharacterized protein n=1 Tax=Mytilinidion resinicola TaxID=574789 RepID=A0A6A6YD68_9PEZI|nr:uncharacterized protein BDZ99DRAFT_523948 [Mytilinidion resinicola]KAF2806508.1 hypothetical protein BDZ99DRAFT_523948 [Mytilinidion resinicola]